MNSKSRLALCKVSSIFYVINGKKYFINVRDGDPNSFKFPKQKQRKFTTQSDAKEPVMPIIKPEEIYEEPPSVILPPFPLLQPTKKLEPQYPKFKFPILQNRTYVSTFNMGLQWVESLEHTTGTD